MEATDWDVTVNMNNEAQKLAAGFNSFSGTTFPLKYTDLYVGPVTRRSGSVLSPQLNEYCTVEDYIPGQFNKWCNNYGFISPEAKSSHTSMPAFMHWSWCNSSGEEMISDLQGVRSDNPQCYTLTDPAMLSLTNSYGPTDMGVEGMAMFFLDHKCNLFCKDLPKPDLSNFVGVIPDSTMLQLQSIGNATSYTHELKFSLSLRQGITTVFRRVACNGS